MYEKGNKVFCDHCNQYVSRKTRYNHNSGRDGENKYTERKRRLEELDSCLSDHGTSPEGPNVKKIRQSATESSGADNIEDPNSEQLQPNDHGTSPEGPNVKKIRQSVTGADNIEDPNSEQLQNSVEPQETSAENLQGELNNSDEQQEMMDENIEPSGERTSEIVSWITASLFSIQLAHNVSDAALIKFFLLLSQIFCVLSPFSAVISTIANIFPKTLYMARKILNIEKNGFSKYVVCPNCYFLYDFDKVVRDGQLKKCYNKVFSCRSATKSRQKGLVNCDTILVDEVIYSDGKQSISPKKVFCYQGVIESLQRFLYRPDFLHKCNAWRHRSITPNLFADVYDGEIWKKFYEYNGSDFLTHSHHFGVMLNVDWFQPYQRRQDISVGALYMVFMNLPREERFKKENCILIGVIPSLKKEPESLNNFLSPLVCELKALWKDVLMAIPGCSTPVTVKMALMCAAADIPAARKLCGFLGHGANQGCSSCTKPLWSNGERDCGIPDLGKWPNRCRSQHLKYVKRIEKADCLSRAKEMEKKCGYRYTSLLDLPYFEPSQMTAIDPMHNLFLVTAKKMFSFWVEKELLTKRSLASLSSKIESFNVPSNTGRIPVNISSNFGQMTAKEWKNWVLVFSLSCLDGLLPTIHLKVWQTFVLACKHFCQPCIEKVNLVIAKNLMVKFCTQVTQLYGAQFITPNMHLHCHLHESVRNFGSMYGFWLFSFERYNGIMSDFHTNKKNIEEQLMKKFLMFSTTTEENLDTEFHSHLKRLSYSSISPIQLTSSGLLTLPTSMITDIKTDCWSDLTHITFRHTVGSPVSVVGKEFHYNLCKVYSFMYRREVSVDNVSGVCTKYSSVHFKNESLGSVSNKQPDRNSHVFASWADDDTNFSDSLTPRLGKIRHFVHNVIELAVGEPVEHVFAYIDWFKTSSDQFGYLNPVSVWSTKLQNDGPASFLPIQRICGKAAWRHEMHNSQRFIVAISVPKASFI